MYAIYVKKEAGSTSFKSCSARLNGVVTLQVQGDYVKKMQNFFNLWRSVTNRLILIGRDCVPGWRAIWINDYLLRRGLLSLPDLSVYWPSNTSPLS